MSKKKAMPRSTMTLKDFHGGTIRSDLELPSAPGMTVDRHSSANVWSSNSPMPMGTKGGGASYHHRQPQPHLLPNAPSGARSSTSSSYDFPNTASLGRNYDEDERRPVDFRPRTSPAATTHHDYSRYDPRGDGGLYFKGTSLDQLHVAPFLPAGGNGRSFGQLQSPPVVAPPTTPPEQQHQPPPVNAWAARRGERVETDPSATSPWRVRNNMARIAEASAIDKVSSGRWQPATGDAFAPRKEPVYDADARKVETLHIAHGTEQQDVDGSTRMPAEIANDCEPHHVERRTSFRRPNEHGFPPRADSSSGHERDDAGSSHTAAYDRLEVHYTHTDRNQPTHNKQHQGDSRDDRESFENSGAGRERPQGQRSLDWERSRPSANQEFMHQSSAHVSTMVGSTYSDSTRAAAASLRPSSGERPKLKLLPRSKPVDGHHDFAEHDELPEQRDNASERDNRESRASAQTDHDMYRTSERPKLSLKPRSQATEVAGSQKERQTLFGGARPREMVLKARGTEDYPLESPEALSDVSELRELQQHRTSEGIISGGGKLVNEDVVVDRYDIRRDPSRQDAKRNIDKQESWRRPVDSTPALSALAEVPPRALGKSYGSSALQLAQAFSRSTAISTAGSRLMDTPSPRYGRTQQRKHNAATAW